MNIEKIRNLGPDELLHQQREAADQLFRLKFQLKMGQTTGLKKMRELRKDLARIKTISRERELGLSTVVGSATSGAAPKTTYEAASAAEKPAVKASPAKGKSSSAKKTSSKKKASAAPKKSAAKKKAKR
ncbi:MAG: 50S ribosomal protein L29 [Acidobacteria bacterium]|nr:50S ribosomal protein L29 [Acidobacteriota bacterium]